MNDLDIDLDRNIPWVDMSACVKFGLDRPSRLAGHTEQRYRQTNKQTNKHNAFYYIDWNLGRAAASIGCLWWELGREARVSGTQFTPREKRKLDAY